MICPAKRSPAPETPTGAGSCCLIKHNLYYFTNGKPDGRKACAILFLLHRGNKQSSVSKGFFLHASGKPVYQLSFLSPVFKE